MAENAEGDGTLLSLEGLVLEGGGVDGLAGLGAGRRGGLDGGLHGLLLDVAGVALAGALGGAEPLAVLLGPGVLGLAPVVADGVEGFGLGLRLKALVLKGCGVGPLALLGAIGLVHEGRLYGLLDRPTAVAALGVASAIPAVRLLLPNVVVLVNEVVLVLTIGVVVGDHLALGPHLDAIDGDIGAAGVIDRLAAKAKELRAGNVVALCRNRSATRIDTGNVEDVLVVLHIRIVDF